MAGDLRAAVRVLMRAPFVPLVVAGLTAVGLGLVLGMWAIIDAAFLRPLPLPDPDRLVLVWETHPVRGQMSVAVANYLDWMPRATSFAAVGGVTDVDVNLNVGGLAQRLVGKKVTSTYFDVWQVPALRGRAFAASDFDGDGRLVVLSAQVWRQSFAADERVIGTTVRLDGQPFTVVGIMPPEASLVGRIDLWLPWRFDARQQTERRFHEIGTFARLKPGVSATTATAELTNVYAQLAADHPDTTRDWRAKAVPLREALVTTQPGVGGLLAGAVAVTFVVAVLNIVSLLVGWWPRRQTELRTRRALGAGTAVIVRQLAIEGALMLSIGAAPGVALAEGFVAAFGQAVAPSTPWFAVDPRLDLRLAAVAVAVLAIMTMGALVLPAWRLVASSGDLAPRRSPARLAASHLAIALQVAAAFVLVVGATTLLESARQLALLAPPSSADRLAIEVSLSDVRYPLEGDQRAFFARLIEAVRALPDVADVGAASYVPPTDALGNVRFDIVGRQESSDVHAASASAIDDRALGLIGGHVVAGRAIDQRDAEQAPKVVAISKTLAQRYWPGRDPLGAAIRLVGVEGAYAVVGVVSDVRRPFSPDPRAEAVMYFSYRQVPWPFMTLVVQPRGDPASAIAGVRRELARIDPDQATGPVRSLATLQTEWLVQPRLQGALVTLFGASTVLLTLAGLYARVAYAVAQRAKECAVRQAVGATPRRVTWLLTSRIATGAAAGLALGALALPAVAGTLSQVAFEASPLAWPRMLGVGALMAIAAAAACYLPARAMRGLDLARLLKCD